MTKLNHITVDDRGIGENEPTFIVAEAACNHMTDMNLARQMIDKAVEAGVDAIKFQTYKAENLVTKDAMAYWGDETSDQLAYYKRLDAFGKNEYSELFAYADEKGIIGFSTPFDADSAEMLAEIGMPIFKIASADLPHLKLLQQIAGFGKPIILSTGASTLDEIDTAIETIFNAGNNQLILMACMLSYPTKNEDANLLRIRTLKERYPEIIIGHSDHTEPDPNMIIPSIAVALGARVIEKHYTLDRNMTGSGHFFAVTPADLEKMVENIRLAELVMGDPDIKVAEAEEPARKSARRSLVAQILIKRGDIITENMLVMKRPATGLPESALGEVIGKRAKQDITPDQQISFEMLEEA